MNQTNYKIILLNSAKEKKETPLNTSLPGKISESLYFESNWNTRLNHPLVLRACVESLPDMSKVCKKLKARRKVELIVAFKTCEYLTLLEMLKL